VYAEFCQASSRHATSGGISNTGAPVPEHVLEPLHYLESVKGGTSL